jgi:hypothetical protein
MIFFEIALVRVKALTDGSLDEEVSSGVLSALSDGATEQRPKTVW